MVAGPMDYTPGAMRNAQEDQFMAVFNRPMSLGTRVHQMAMYVVFESPLQMLADSPSNYLDEPECTEFITGVPTVWDETRVISGAVGDWIAVARRRGEEWFVGAMTDWSERDIELDLSFLGDASWTAEIFADGPNAHRNAEDFQIESQTIQRRDRPTAHLAPGGGWVAKFTKASG
jgi:alpha-glucosidase